jgi:hypothetical protein
VRTAELDIGALIAERYRVRKLLGIGGMSRVYLAHDDVLGRDVAVKVFATAVGDGSDADRRRDEVTLLAGLTHPALVVLFDAALDADPPYLTMECVAGETLVERIHRGRVLPGEAESIGIAIAGVLGFVHERGIVHRDVKPANVLLPASPGTGSPAKLTDFGIARLVDSGRMTATGTVLGTAAYISPEQAAGGIAGPPSDVYALGLVLIELLTGTHPFPGTALESAAARLTRTPDLEAPELAPYRSLLTRMTAMAPEARPSAAEVAADLAGEARTHAMTPVDAATEDLGAAAAVGVAVLPATRPGTASVEGNVVPRVKAVRHPTSLRARIGIAVTALFAVLAVAAVVLLLVPPGTPEPSYPEVPGALGIHLGQLQDAVAGSGLEDSVLAAARAADDGDYTAADGLLQATLTLAQQGLASGAIGADDAVQIEAAIAAARADIATLLSPPAVESPDEPTDTVGEGGNGNGNNGSGHGNGHNKG